MTAYIWLSDNYIEVFGAVAGFVYVFLEIRQTIWLWPVGIITSAVYIWVFFTGKLYADMSLQAYYLAISMLGWYWWLKGAGHRAQGGGLKKEEENGRGGEWENMRRNDLETKGLRVEETEILVVTRLKPKTGILLALVFVILYGIMWVVLTKFTDSPVPLWDAFITSLSVVATWMLARKIYEHWFLWIVVNGVAAVLFLSRGLYPTVVLYGVYFAMSFIGLKEWRKALPHPPAPSPEGEGE